MRPLYLHDTAICLRAIPVGILLILIFVPSFILLVVICYLSKRAGKVFNDLEKEQKKQMRETWSNQN